MRLRFGVADAWLRLITALKDNTSLTSLDITHHTFPMQVGYSSGHPRAVGR